MYFYKMNGRVYMDCAGDFVITRNAAIVLAAKKQAAPLRVLNVSGVSAVGRFGFLHKLRASWRALRFIWGRGPALNIGAPVVYEKDGA